MAAGWRGEFIKTKTDLRREYYFSLKWCADLMMRVQTSLACLLLDALLFKLRRL